MERRKRRKKRQILPESVPERHSPSGAKGSAFPFANAPAQGLYSAKDRICKILSFSDLNTKMVEARGVEPRSCRDLPRASTCLGHDSILVLGVGGVHTRPRKHPSVESRQSVRRHDFMTSLMRAPLSLIRHPGSDVAVLKQRVRVRCSQLFF